LIIKYKKNSTSGSDVKIIVSLKVSKKAVVRNKIRRRIREILKPKDLSGYDLVVITNKDILDKDFQEIKKMIDARLRI